MKRRIFWIATLVCAALFCFAVSGETLTWADPAETPELSASGYPRFAMRADGTLLLTADNGYIYHSSDAGKTFTRMPQKAVAAAATGVTTASGTTHTLTRANLQPYVLPDGRVLLAYRSHTSSYSSGEFYTSIRLLTSTDGGVTFSDEQILVEATHPSAQRGFWEPFFMQIDADTIALYYADDLNVKKLGSQQQIAYLTYTLSTGEWSTAPKTAIYRPDMKSRDGMPTVTALCDGGFAMVVEAHDYTSTNSSYKTSFVVGLSLSRDGRTWTDPVPVAAPTDLLAGQRTSAPSIATLPDGRVLITYMTDETYTGDYGTGDRCRVFGAMISDAPLYTDSELTATTGGAAPGFTRLDGLFANSENRFQIWNTVSVFGNDVYVAGTAATNTASGGTIDSTIRIRRGYAADTGFAPGSSAAYFVDNASGADTNDGLTAATAFKTLGKAISCLKANGGKIVISGPVAISSAWTPAANSGAIVVTSCYGGVDYRITNNARLGISANIAFQGDFYFEKVRLTIRKSTLYFSARFHNLGFGEGVDVVDGVGTDGFLYPTIVGGYYGPTTLAAATSDADYSITIKSGKWQSFSGGNFRTAAGQPIGSVAGNVAIEVCGGEFFANVYGTGMNVHSGRVSFAISGGIFHSRVIPFKRYGTIPTDSAMLTDGRADGNMLVRITGGQFLPETTNLRLSESNVATNCTSYPIYSTATVVITGGEFSGLVCGYAIAGTTLLKYSPDVLSADKIEGFPNVRTQTLTRATSALENSALTLPMLNKADPYVIEKDDVYYYCFSSATTVDGIGYSAIKIVASGSVAIGDVNTVSNALRTVFHAGMTDLENAQKEYWAPELHYFTAAEVGASAAGWYIYVAADNGDNNNHRIYVLRATDPENPLSDYEMVGKLTSADDHWAIDGTVLHLNGKIYFVWSGWAGTTNVAQNLYIAEMSSPTTISSARTMLSSPTYSWETHGSPTVNEGPEILQKDGTTHIVYSASGSWTQYYCYGILTYTGSDPLSASSWTKNSTSVFSSSDANGVYGPGHGTFVQDANGEWWMIYHANASTTVPSGSTWWAERHVYMKKFTWTTKTIGSTSYAWPSFGTPTAAMQYEIVKTADYHAAGDHIFGATYRLGGGDVSETRHTCLDCGAVESFGVQYATKPTLSVISTAGAAALTWTKVDGATGYRISRKAPGESTYSFYQAVTGADTCFFADTELIAGERYGYMVCATFTDSAGSAQYSALSDGKDVLIQPGIPGITLSANVDGGILITVSTPVNCAGYIYYRSTDGENFTVIATTPATVYADTTGDVGTTYAYKVAAYATETCIGEPSEVKSRAATPAAPKILSGAYDGTAVTITWSAVDGISRYKVFRRVDGDGTWTSTYVAASQTSYTDKTAVAGTKYIYAVQSDQLVGSARYYSSITPVQAPIYPIAPNFAVTASAHAVTVSWDAVEGAEGYILSRKAPGASEFAVYQNLDAAANRFTETPLVVGEYAYALCAVYTSELGAANSLPVTDCAAVAHGFTVTAAVAPTCEADGRTAIETCAECGETHGGESIPALGHNFAVTAEAVAPTYEADGRTAVETCANCGATRGGEILPKLIPPTPVFTEVAQGAVYDAVAARAGEKKFALSALSFIGEPFTGELTGVLAIPADFVGEQVYVYRLDGEYMPLVAATPDGEGNVTFAVFTEGDYVIANAPLVLYGDANGDGQITLVDALRILKYIAGQEVALDKAAADIDPTLTINLADALRALRVLLNT